MVMFNKIFSDFFINVVLGISINVSKVNFLMIDFKIVFLYCFNVFIVFNIIFFLKGYIN